MIFLDDFEIPMMGLITTRLPSKGNMSATFFSNNRSCVQNPRDAAELEEVTGLVAYILDQSMYMSGHFHLSFPGV